MSIDIWAPHKWIWEVPASQTTQFTRKVGVSVSEEIKPWDDVKNDFLSSEESSWGNDVKRGILEILWNEGIVTEDIIAIPWYYKEESHRIIQVLSSLKWNFTAVLYFNWVPEAGNEEFTIRFNDIKRMLEKDGNSKKIVLVKHAYPERANLWMIRWDMIQGIIEATSSTLSDPVIYWLDADTYSLKEDYIRNARQTFDEDKSVDFLRSQLRWTNGSQEWYAWLSEILMHIGNIVHNQKHVISMGWATSFRLRSYIRVNGYKKGMDMGEDIQLWKDMKEGNPNGWKKFWWKVYVDPRRGIESIHLWRRFQDQWIWMKSYSFVEKDIIYTNDSVSWLNEIVTGLVWWKSIGEIELSQFCWHLEWRYFVGKRRADIRKLFIRFWNINQAFSLYRAIENKDGKIEFVIKSTNEAGFI